MNGERKQMPNLATSQAVFSDFGDVVSDIFSLFACHPRQAALPILQLFIPAWIGGNLGALYDLFDELLKRVRKGHFAAFTILMLVACSLSLRPVTTS